MLEVTLGGNDPKLALVAKVRSHLAGDFPDESKSWSDDFILQQLEAAVAYLNGINPKNPLQIRLQSLDFNLEVCVLEIAVAYCLEEKAMQCEATARRYRIFAKESRNRFERLAKNIAQIRPFSAP